MFTREELYRAHIRDRIEEGRKDTELGNDNKEGNSRP